jgi:hypothetical protein
MFRNTKLLIFILVISAFKQPNIRIIHVIIAYVYSTLVENYIVKL